MRAGASAARPKRAVHDSGSSGKSVTLGGGAPYCGWSAASLIHWYSRSLSGLTDG
jgi:D-tyrosyl-tRNA(Tyr) deacylase